MPRTVSGDSTPVTLTNILQVLWDIRAWILGGAAIAILAAIAFILVLRVADETRSQYVIEFRFEGRANDRYPNGVPFSLGDIIAPAVLAEVYDRQGLAGEGIELRDFQATISISPYVPNRAAIINSYREALDSRRSTIAELQQAQESLRRDLDLASQRYAVITLSQRGFGLPDDKAASVLIDIAKTWERIAIETRGVLKQDIQTVDPKIFDEINVKLLDPLSTIDFVRSNIGALKSFLIAQAALPGSNLVEDKATGWNIEALSRLVDRSAIQLTKLPGDWTRSTTNLEPLALGSPINLYSETLFDPNQVENMEYLVAIDLLLDRAKLLRGNVQKILEQPFGDVAVDPDTKLAARDIDRLLVDITEGDIKQITAPILSLGIAKDPDFVKIYYNSRLQELQRSKQTLESKARVLESAGQGYQGLADSSRGTAPASGDFSGSSTVIPQFGDAFLDRIITLSQQGGDAKFRQDLIKQMVDLQEQGADLDNEIARIREYINIFAKLSDETSGTSGHQGFVTKIRADIPAIMGRLKGYAAVTERIALRLRLAQDIHRTTVGTGTGGAVDVDFYLRDGGIEAVSMPVLLNQLKSYAESANNIYDSLSAASLGNYMRLFRAAAEPQRIARQWITSFDGFLGVLAGLLGAIVGLVGGLVNRRRAFTT